MDMMKTSGLIHAYIRCGEFLKAKAANKKRRSSTNIGHWKVGMQLGSIEEGLCNYEAAIVHFREVVAEP